MPTRHSRPPRTDARPCLTPHAAGLDIGREELWACVPEDRDAEPVRPFGTLTPDLAALAAWLPACRMETVAMASTGVSWILVDEILAARGFRVSVIQARHLTQVPGRQREVTDGQGMQSWQTCGWLSRAFRPEAERWAWRASWRQRATWLEYRAAHLQPRQKALPPMHGP